MSWRGTVLLLLLSCIPAGAPAQTVCPVDPSGQPLVQPGVIRPEKGVLDTILVVDLAGHKCVPVWNGTNWTTQTMNLRTYGWPIDGDRSKLQWTFPGPTFRIKKTILQDPSVPPSTSNPVKELGTLTRIGLYNQLPNNSYPYDACDPETVTSSDGKTKSTLKPMSCFHGIDVTNIHYHGTHTSPQAHHDFVLLNLYSSKQTNPPPPPPDAYNQVGFYQTEIDPLPWNQAPGTLWYHPHKHGSTAGQVINGMAGALLVEGPFDDWLDALYGIDPDDDKQLETFEKVMVIEQIQEDVNFFNPAAKAAQPLINGQAVPVVQMRPGEIQRWRLIAATMQASAALKITFPSTVTIKQIAQDGVQFAWENYNSQPLVTYNADGTATYDIAPGQRGDLLVQAKSQTGRTHVKFGLLAENIKDTVRRVVEQRAAAEAPVAAHGSKAALAAARPALFSIDIGGAPVSMQFPLAPPATECVMPPLPKQCWPKTPTFLEDLPDSGKKRTVAFSMRDPHTGVCSGPGSATNSFWIDKTQFQEGCANYTLELGDTETWTVTNDSPLPHPFHIHINPFQVLQNGAKTFSPPYVWQDTIPLAVGTKCPTGSTDPACPTGCNVLSAVKIRQRYDDYTGPYVIHCHFLGHEDRGMMLAVQAVCDNAPDTWGQPQVSGADNCGIAEPALPQCSASPGSGHHH